ncbi:unnamed protein product (macronuclear) [Paramecium tetraurelia]|uniref:Uncharacterized protein n=1 Tax=Paramecium tetraurelia TaxID=5888 RepID=A0DNQ8_PARTE|nr:uncharacterized protein GSPATT00018871001 [Paramecium tetraurelia]CAK84675.1 unnamed protein product [Paramecium tetraurelia]|eukprot:XP_001452072.1 hypothetical protein (macronuclear) [Paramecium tetraurelia strain d4-2]
MNDLQKKQENILKIWDILKNHNYYLLKSNLPSIIQFFLSLHSNNSQNKFQTGLKLAKSCDLLNAIKIFDEILKIDERYTDCYYQKGLALMNLDKKNLDYLQKSVYCFQKAIEIDQFHFDAYKNQGICLFQLEQYDQALKCFDCAINYGLYDKECLLYKAKVLQINDRNLEACKIFDKIIEEDSRDVESYFYKGVLIILIQVEVYPYITQKSINRHNNILIKLLTLIQRQFQFQTLGDLLLDLEKEDEARNYFDKVIEIDPKNLYAYLGKILTFKNFQNKMKTLNEAIEAGNKSNKLLLIKGIMILALGDLLQNERNYDQAIEQYNELIGSKLSTQESWMLYYNKGTLLFIQNEEIQRSL